MNRRILPLLVLIALLATGVFGLLLMSGAAHDGMPCSIPTMAAMDCTTLSDALVMVQHHVKSFQMLFLAMIAAVLSIIVRVFVRQLNVSAIVRLENDTSLRYRATDLETCTVYARRVRRWFACLVAYDDAFAFQRVHVWSSM